MRLALADLLLGLDRQGTGLIDFSLDVAVHHHRVLHKLDMAEQQ